MLTLILTACTPDADTGAPTTTSTPTLAYEAWEHVCDGRGDTATVPGFDVAPLLVQGWRLTIDTETGAWTRAEALPVAVVRGEDLTLTCTSGAEVLRVVYAIDG